LLDRRGILAAITGSAIIGGVGFPSVARGADTDFAKEDWKAARWYADNRRFAETSFGRISYVSRGSGPAALFLHGFPLSSFQWRGAIERLSDERTCVAPDFLGLGHTQVAHGQKVDPSAQVEMIAAFLDGLQIGNVDIVANDSGGAVAQLFAARYPDRARSLMLTNCDVETDSPPPALLPVIELAEKGTYPDDWLAPWLADKELARSPQGIGGMCYSDPLQPTDAAIVMYFSPILSSASTKQLVNAYTIGLKVNPLAGIEPALRSLKIPVSVVWGMSDTIFSTKSPDYLAGVLPNLRNLRRLPDGKLFFPEERPDIIAEEARRLWAL
jgi:pimeloyl-ACP methyl ester carboxylesterase